MYPDTATLHDVVEEFRKHGYINKYDDWVGGSINLGPVVDEEHNYFAIPWEWSTHSEVTELVEEPMLKGVVLGYVLLFYRRDMMAYPWTAEDTGKYQIDVLDWWAEFRMKNGSHRTSTVRTNSVESRTNGGTSTGTHPGTQHSPVSRRISNGKGSRRCTSNASIRGPTLVSRDYRGMDIR